MKALKITSFRSGKTFSEPHFFILSKGLNSGKPLLKPCPNCFVVECASEPEKEQLYWLAYSLWQSKAFYPYQKGSVIPFITIKDASECITTARHSVDQDPERFTKAVTALRELETLAQTYQHNLKLISQAKQLLFYKYLS